jgi:acyl carrier protein
MASIRSEIVEIIRQASKPREPDLSDDSKPLLDSGLDSLDYATVLMAVEEKYNLQIAEKDMESLGSLKDMVAFVEKQSGKSA